MFWFDFAFDIQHVLNHYWWPINAALLIIAAIVGYLAYKKPAYAAGITIILLPTYLFRSYIDFLPFTFLEVCIWVTFLGWLASSIKKNGLHATRLHSFGATASEATYRLPMLLILIASTASLVIAPNFSAAAGLWKAYFIEPLLFFIVLLDVLREPKNRTIILWSLGISTLSVSLLAIYQKFTAFGIFEPSWVGVEHRRVTAMFTSPNAVGLFLGPIVALYFGWIVSEFKNFKATALKMVVVALALIAICFTVSQGTWLGLVAATVFLLFFGWNKKWSGALVMLGVLTILFIPQLRERAVPLLTLQDVSGQNRLMLWSVAGEYLTGNIGNFLYGAGILGYAQIQDATRDPLIIEPLLYPHNIILNFWLEIGLLGLLAFGLVIVIFFKQGFGQLQSNKWLALGTMAAMVTMLVHGLIDVTYFKNDLAVLFWIIIALPLTLQKN